MNAADNDLNNSNDGDILDLGVSVDGSRQRRGFTSRNGVMTALSINNGKVVDVEPMTRYCRQCFVITRILVGVIECMEEKSRRKMQAYT